MWNARINNKRGTESIMSFTDEKARKQIQIRSRIYSFFKLIQNNLMIYQVRRFLKIDEKPDRLRFLEFKLTKILSATVVNPSSVDLLLVILLLFICFQRFKIVAVCITLSLIKNGTSDKKSDQLKAHVV